MELNNKLLLGDFYYLKKDFNGQIRIELIAET